MRQPSVAAPALAAVLAVVGACGMTGTDPARLATGDCFTVPGGDTVSGVTVRPCTEAHDGEVLAIGSIQGDGTYPAEGDFDAWVQAECVDGAFEAYVGEAFQDREDIDVRYFAPTAERWGEGDRGMICYLSPAGGEPVSTSFRAGATTAP